jgi:hypothetical protein
MSIQIKQRLYISFVVLAMISLLVIGINILTNLNEARSIAISECMEKNIYPFEFCFTKSNQDISPSFFNYISPFLPAAILIWISWLLKLNFQIELDLTQYKKIRKFVFGLGCLICALGTFLPFYIVIEKDMGRLTSISIYQLFIIPWIATAWLCAPLLFQKLLDPEKVLIEFIKLRKFVVIVIGAPLLSLVLLILRQLLNR